MKDHQHQLHYFLQWFQNCGINSIYKIFICPFLNLIDQWQMIIIFLSIASMLFGAVAAIGQTNIKRLIAYSSIGHIGYTLAG